MNTIRENHPATHKNAVIMSCDGNYFPYATLLAAQIDATTPDRDFDICIVCSDPVGDHPLVARHNIRMIAVDIPEAWAGLATSNKITLAAYIRVIMPRLLAQDYARLLYLDSDILYERGDISALLRADLGGRPVGAVLDNVQHRKPKRPSPEFKEAGIEGVKYFNSGVLLIDVAEFIAQDIEAKTFEHAGTDNPKLRVKHDQSALNLALVQNWAELPPQWNWPSFHKYFLFTHFADPCFVHFMSSRKPWRDTRGIYPRKYVRLYETHMQDHFPDRAADMPKGRPATQSLGLWRVLYLRHMTDFKRIMAYLERFSSDLDIK